MFPAEILGRLSLLTFTESLVVMLEALVAEKGIHSESRVSPARFTVELYVLLGPAVAVVPLIRMGASPLPVADQERVMVGVLQASTVSRVPIGCTTG